MKRMRCSGSWRSHWSGERSPAGGLVWIQSWQKLPDGGDLEEPVEAGLLRRVVHVIHCEGV